MICSGCSTARPKISGKRCQAAKPSLLLGMLALIPSSTLAEFSLPEPDSHLYYSHTIVAGEEIKVRSRVQVAGNVHSNGSVNLNRGSSVDGDVSAVETIRMRGTVTGAVLEGAEPRSLPRLYSRDEALALADRAFSEDTVFDDEVIDDIVFVDGEVLIRGSILGTGTVIASGRIHLAFSGSNETAGSDSLTQSNTWLLPTPPPTGMRLALIAGGDIEIARGSSIGAVLRAGGEIKLGRAVWLEGSLMADRGVTVKRDSVVNFVDTAPPVIELDHPSANDLFNTLVIPVSGTVTDDGLIQTVTLNGRQIEWTGDTFAESAVVPPGETEVIVEATDGAGRTTSLSVPVRVDLEPPEVVVSEPLPNQVTNASVVTVRGRARDPVGIEGVEINGQPTTLDGEMFTAELELDDGSNELVVEAIDTAGNRRRVELGLEVFAVPEIAIIQPEALSVVTTATARVRGTVSEAVSSVTVNRVTAELSSGAFTVSVPLHEGINPLTVVARTGAGRAATKTMNVIRDSTPPRLTLEWPLQDEIVQSHSIVVRGMVSELVATPSDVASVSVTVNGSPAFVDNDAFLSSELSLQPGVNPLLVEATDERGNTAQLESRVVFDPAPGPRISIASGNLQSAPIATALHEPLAVLLTDASGQSVAGTHVVFKTRGNDGGFEGGVRRIAVETDANGLAETTFTTGTLAGAGTQVVEASAVGFAGPAIFVASATRAAPDRILVDSGNGQVGAVGQPLPLPLSVAVVDAGFNRLPGIPVEFRVVSGDGALGEDGSTLRVSTDSLGRAWTNLVLGDGEGTGNNVVTARLVDVPDSGVATFAASGKTVGEAQNTSITGVVLDNTDLPVPGASVKIADTDIETLTGTNGVFRLDAVPLDTVHLEIDASTTSRPGTWPHLEFVMFPVAGQDNQLDRPVYVLPLDVAGGLPVSETQGGTLQLDEVPGFALEIAPGSVTFPDGSRDGVISVTTVQTDRVPMLPNLGQQPRFIITIQPAGAVFDPPAKMTLPNVDGLAPGQVTELYSFDHDLGAFVSIGRATVSDNGLVIASNPGIGVLKAGWHCGLNPRSQSGTPHRCRQCQSCNGSDCEADSDLNGLPCEPEDSFRNATDDCVVERKCRDGSCIETELMMERLDGPSCIATGDPAQFSADANAPDRIQWKVLAKDFPANSPPTGNGPTFTHRFLDLTGENQFFTSIVAAGCGSNFLTESVSVGPSCDTDFGFDLSTTRLPPRSVGPDYFGGFDPATAIGYFSSCVDDGTRCGVMTGLKYEYWFDLWDPADDPTGPTPISGADDPLITPETCEDVLLSLTPFDRTDEPGWNPDDLQGEKVADFGKYIYLPVVRAHEEFHAGDYEVNVVLPAIAEASEAVRDICSGCQAEPPGLFSKWLDIYSMRRISWNQTAEQRAFRDTNPDLFELVDDILRRILMSPDNDQYPAICGGAAP